MVPNQANFADLAARIAKLEIQNRRWKLATGLLGLLGVSVVLMGAKPVERFDPPVVRARVVEAEEFLLKDDNGHIYARLTLKADKNRINDHAFGYSTPAELDFYDGNGDLAATIPAGPGFVPTK